MSGIRETRPDLLLLCLAAVVVRVPFIFTVPMREAPDEFSHFWVIKFLHDHLRLPTAAEVTAGGASAVYGSLPQLGYLPHVLLSMPFPEPLLMLVARFGSLLMGLIMIWAAYHAGRLLFKKDGVLALALPAMLIVHPQLTFLHCYSNSDSTSSALSSVIILLMLQIIYHGVNLRLATIIGALSGWVALSKFSALAVIPVVALAVVVSTIIHGSGWGLALLALTSMAAASAVVSGWWFVRNYFEFNGDIMGTKTMYATWAKLFSRKQDFYLPASHIVKNFSWWRMLFFSYWGLFGYMTRYMWRPVYVVYAIFFFASLAGMIRTTCSGMKICLIEGRRLLTAQSIAWTCLLLIVLINIASIIWASMVNLGGPQGRYLFTSEIPITALIILGLSSISRKWGKRFVIVFLIWNAIVCIGSFVYLFSLYGFNPRPY